MPSGALKHASATVATGGGGAFSPADLPNLGLWLDASAISSLADGASVTQWDDLSGNGRHATQATAASMPLWRDAANGIAGQPALQFDGTNDYLTLGDVLDPGVSSFSIFTVFVSTVGGAAQRLYQKRGTGSFGAQAGWAIARGTSSWNNIAVDDGAGKYRQVDLLNLSNGNPHRLAFLFDATTGTLDAKSSADTDKQATGAALASIDITRPTTIGCADNGGGVRSQFLAGKVAEIIHVERRCSTGEIDDVHDYILGKYGV